MDRRDGAARLIPLPSSLRPPLPLGGRRPPASAHPAPATLTAVGLLLLLGLLATRVTGTERGTVLVLLVGALPLTLLPGYPLLALSLWLRSRVLVAGSLLVVAAHVAVVLPTVGAEPVPDGAAGAPHLRVVVANLYRLNPQPQAAAADLRGLDADVLVVSELDPRGRRALADAGVPDDLPFTVEVTDQEAETVGLLSRLPLDDVVLRRVGGRVLPQATLTVGGHEVRVLAVHPLPPVAGWEPLWRATLADTAREADRQDLPLVVAGDLNADRDHAAFRSLLDTGLRDAHDERGRGLARTWPARLPVLHLDHVLVRDGAGADLAVLDVGERVLPGSDHRAVVVDLAVLPPR